MAIYSKASEWFWFNEPFFLNNFTPNSAKYSSVLQQTTINLNAESNGKIPQGISAVSLQLGASDSASASSNCWVNLYRDTSSLYVLQRNIGLYNGVGPGYRDNTWSQEQGIVPCDANGNIAYRCVASGADTMAISIIIIGFAKPTKKGLFWW